MSQLNCFKKKVYQPRRKKEGPYVKTNAYSQPFSKQQIITAILFIIQLACHSVFIVPPITYLRYQLLIILLSFHYALFILIIYDYIILTTSDPVDQLILEEEMIIRYDPNNLHTCTICDKLVRKSSHHCSRCNRCTQEFDHHCKYLNNCIGFKNYEPFIRLLCVDFIFNLNVMGQAIWIIIRNFQSQNIAFQGNKWGVLATLILTFLIQIAVASLFFFHVYISCYEFTTTFEHMYPPVKKQAPNINIIEAMESGDRMRRPRLV